MQRKTFVDGHNVRNAATSVHHTVRCASRNVQDSLGRHRNLDLVEPSPSVIHVLTDFLENGRATWKLVGLELCVAILNEEAHFSVPSFATAVRELRQMLCKNTASQAKDGVRQCVTFVGGHSVILMFSSTYGRPTA